MLLIKPGREEERCCPNSLLLRSSSKAYISLFLAVSFLYSCRLKFELQLCYQSICYWSLVVSLHVISSVIGTDLKGLSEPKHSYLFSRFLPDFCELSDLSVILCSLLDLHMKITLVDYTPY